MDSIMNINPMMLGVLAGNTMDTSLRIARFLLASAILLSMAAVLASGTAWLGPSEAERHKLRGNELFYTGNYDAAIAEYTEALRIKPDFALAYYNLGTAYQAKRDFNRALESYNQAIALDPQDAQAYFGRGNLHSLMSDPTGALRDLDRAIELDPYHYEAHLFRGFSHFQKASFQQAIVDLDRATELNPASAEPYFYRGLIHFDNGALEQALAELTQAIELDPEYAWAYYQRGLIYSHLTGKGEDDRRKALADMRQALAAATDADLKIWVQEELEQLEGR